MNSYLNGILKNKYDKYCSFLLEFQNVTFDDCVNKQSLYELMFYTIITTEREGHSYRYLDDSRTYSMGFKQRIILYLFKSRKTFEGTQLLSLFGDFSKEAQEAIVEETGIKVLYIENVHPDISVQLLREFFESDIRLYSTYEQFFHPKCKVGKRLGKSPEFVKELNRMKLMHPSFFEEALTRKRIHL